MKTQGEKPHGKAARRNSGPKVSFCVPSRNRQKYFKQTIVDLLSTPRTDVEFVFADNSSDPSIMNAFMAEIAADSRVVYLQSGTSVLPMNDNWERCIEASRGDWVVFIGDDDYIDVGIVDLIENIVAKHGAADAVTWGRINYNWPGSRDLLSSIIINLGDRVEKVGRTDLFRRNFLWEGANVVPMSSFCFYHGAVSRRILEKMKNRFGGRYCEHITVDFENACKVVLVGENFYYSERPYSVLGSCPESNSATIGTLERVKKAHAEAMREIGRNIDEDPYMKDFPFPGILGVTAAVAQVQQWFKHKYKINIDGWESEFAKACGDNCRLSRSIEIYETVYCGYYDAFSKWRQGEYLEFFLHDAPIYDSIEKKIFTGIHDGKLYFREDMAGVATPRAVYDLVDAMFPAAENLDYLSTDSRLVLSERESSPGFAGWQ